MSQDDELPQGLREAFARAREVAPPRERVSAIATKLGPALDRPATPTIASGARRWLPRIGLGVVVLGVMAGGAVLWVTRVPHAASERRAPTIEPRPSHAAAPIATREARAEQNRPLPASVEQTTSAQVPRLRAPDPTRHEAASRRETPRVAPTLAPEVTIPPLDRPESIVAEDALVGSAQRALRTSPARALALATEHARRFPDGALTQERELIAIEALVSIGRAAEARARGRAFLARWPSSAHAPRVRAIVAWENAR